MKPELSNLEVTTKGNIVAVIDPAFEGGLPEFYFINGIAEYENRFGDLYMCFSYENY